MSGWLARPILLASPSPCPDPQGTGSRRAAAAPFSRTRWRTAVSVENGGALVVMGDRCQKDYRHSVRKQKQGAGARLSLNFLMHVALA